MQKYLADHLTASYTEEDFFKIYLNGFAFIYPKVQSPSLVVVKVIYQNYKATGLI